MTDFGAWPDPYLNDTKQYEQFCSTYSRWFPVSLEDMPSLGGFWFVNDMLPFVGGFPAEQLGSLLARGTVREIN